MSFAWKEVVISMTIAASLTAMVVILRPDPEAAQKAWFKEHPTEPHVQERVLKMKTVGPVFTQDGTVKVLCEHRNGIGMRELTAKVRLKSERELPLGTILEVDIVFPPPLGTKGHLAASDF